METVGRVEGCQGLIGFQGLGFATRDFQSGFRISSEGSSRP